LAEQRYHENNAIANWDGSAPDAIRVSDLN
jgi:hypothetical protein